MPNLLKRLEAMRPFKPNEAWLIFRMAAFGEAIGWTLLISGILIKRYVVHGNNIPVLIAGQIHGTLFILYFAASIILYPSLYWKRSRALVAVAASVPPYGSLLFERVEAYRQRRHNFQTRSRVLIYQKLIEDMALTS